MLVRKHELESASRKASHRGWDKVFCAVVGSGMAFYKVSHELALSRKVRLKRMARAVIHELMRS